MQRRAAAVSVAFFLVISAGSYAFIGVAQEPAISIENPDHTVQSNQTLTVGGTTYTFGEIGDGSATATWTNQSARYTATLENGSVVEYRGTNYTVHPASGEDPSHFRLVENQTVDRPTTTHNGTTYVIVEDESGSRTLVPRDEYLPPPQEHTFAEGDDFDYQGNTTTVVDVTRSGVTLEWFAPRTNEIIVREGGNQTLGDTPYLAHFVRTDSGDYELQFTDRYQEYENDVTAQDYYKERINGLWAVSILSALAAIFILMLSFLPPRY